MPNLFNFLFLQFAVVREEDLIDQSIGKGNPKWKNIHQYIYKKMLCKSSCVIWKLYMLRGDFKRYFFKDDRALGGGGLQPFFSRRGKNNWYFSSPKCYKRKAKLISKVPKCNKCSKYKGSIHQSPLCSLSRKIECVLFIHFFVFWKLFYMCTVK